MNKRLALVGAVLLALLLAVQGYQLYAQDDLDYLVYAPIMAKGFMPPTATPTATQLPPTATATATSTSTPTPTATRQPQWLFFLTGFDDIRMKGLPTGSTRRTSMTDYWDDTVYPNGVFIVLFMDVVNCDMQSAHVSRIDTFWMRDGNGPSFDMAPLEAQWAAEYEYSRIGVYETLQPQFTYKMVFVFDVPPAGSYDLWYIPWGSSASERLEFLPGLE